MYSAHSLLVVAHCSGGAVTVHPSLGGMVSQFWRGHRFGVGVVSHFMVTVTVGVVGHPGFGPGTVIGVPWAMQGARGIGRPGHMDGWGGNMGQGTGRVLVTVWQAGQMAGGETMAIANALRLLAVREDRY